MTSSIHTTKKRAPRADAPAATGAGNARRRGAQPEPTPAPSVDERLGLRRPPIQGRGLLTFERVLATASDILVQVGAEGLTTNLIASESGVNISSIYKYFPNKQAILVTLFERNNQQRVEDAQKVLAALDTADNWRRVVDRAIDKMLQGRLATPGNVALRRAMRSSPELADIDQRANAAMADWLSHHIRRLTGLSPRRALIVARIAVEAEAALLDWWESPEVDHAKAVALEVKALINAYLGLYAPAPPANGK